MPPAYGRIPTLPEDLEQGALVGALNQTIEVINSVLDDIALAETLTRGEEDQRPTISNVLSMQQNRITNTRRSRLPNDVVTRIELEEIGLFTNDGQISFNGEVNFANGATVSGGTSGSSAVTSVAQVAEVTAAATEGIVATNTDGDRISIRDDNVSGTAQGTLAMYRDGNGRAAVAQVHQGAQITADLGVKALLELVLIELRRLNGVPNSGQSVE